MGSNIGIGSFFTGSTGDITAFPGIAADNDDSRIVIDVEGILDGAREIVVLILDGSTGEDRARGSRDTLGFIMIDQGRIDFESFGFHGFG